ncbi:P-loop NTPase fold protein [Alcaligenes aquatilis]|uniref:KAP family P-loop NTPase fold protein n=1 Tax=Alcaligenes aquatilis TaxID=323284 RepID=UPI003209758C
MTGFFHDLSIWNDRRRRERTAKASRVAGGDGEIGAEAPIRTASEDRLKRANFASRVAGVLSALNLREGRVFAIRGGWGFGKSSLKFLITEHLKASKQADCLDFNPWQWGEGDYITRALFGQMANCLGGEYSAAALARAAALRRYGNLLAGAGKPLKEFGGSGGIVSILLTNSSVIAIASAIGFELTAAVLAATLAAVVIFVSIVGRAMLYFGRDRSNESLDKVREELEARLKKLERPLVVFVDDIDRLEPGQIRLLLRQVKANANLPNIVFVLIFQPNIVERALDQISDGDGRAFLEKIVQVNFDLPAVPASSVHDSFHEGLSALIGPYATEQNGFTKMRWANVSIGCIQPLVRNLRDVRRLISSIAVHLPLHVVDGVLEVNIIDFFLLETLRVFAPSLYASLFREKELLLLEGFFSANDSSAAKTAVEKLLTDVPEPTREVVLNMLKELFPALIRAYGETTIGSGNQQFWLNDKRVCSSRYFPRYFELQTAVGEMSERRFIDFLEATEMSSRLSDAIGTVEVDGLLLSLIGRLSESVSRLPIGNAAVLLPGLFEIAEKARYIDDGLFSSPLMITASTINQFLKHIPESGRGVLALEALRSTRGLSVGSILIQYNDPAEHATAVPALNPSTVAEMKAIWLDLMRDRAADDVTLIDDPKIMALLYRWRDYAGSMDEPRDWVDKAIQTDQGFAKIARGMMVRGTLYSSGDRISTPHYSFNKDTVDSFIGVSAAKARCDAIDSSKFPEYEQVLATLLFYLEGWLGLREIGTTDPSFVDSY